MMRNPIRALAAALAAAALSCLVIGACGCTGGAALRDGLVGTWDYDLDTIARFVGQDLTDEQVQAARELMFLNLDEDGAAELVLFGEIRSGSWEPGGAGGADATITVEGDAYPARLDDGVLTMGEGETALVFEKAAYLREPPSADECAAAMEALVGIGPERTADAPIVVPEGGRIETEAFDEPVVIGDDEVATILVTAIGTNALGDPGYSLHVANNSDSTVYMGTGEFTVGGAGVTAYGSETLAPGEEKDVFLAFDAADFGGQATPDALVDVAGVLTVNDDATTSVLAYYDFAM